MDYRVATELGKNGETGQAGFTLALTFVQSAKSDLIDCLNEETLRLSCADEVTFMEAGAAGLMFQLGVKHVG